MRIPIPFLLAIVPLMAAVPLHAQELRVPDGWIVRADGGHATVTAAAAEHGDPAAHTIRLVGMPPGWHVTTGPAAILYHPAHTASGTFRIVSDLILFPPGEVSGGYGIVVGGRDLDGAQPRYVAFQVRRDGAFRIALRNGAAERIIRDWARHDAVKPWTTGTVTNVLSVAADQANVTFLVNGTGVAGMPREDVPIDGIFGLRIDAGMNLHVTRLETVPPGGGP